MDAIDFAVLDQAEACTPNPAVWRANLAAAAEELPAYVEILRNTEIPPQWRPVLGLDGFPTYRIESPGASPVWLCGAGAPRVRAEGTVRLKDHADKNPALPSISTGALLMLLLGRLRRQQAVYVFERDPVLLAAVLRNIDISEDIRLGRCIPLPPNEEESYLKSLLERRPGLEPPGTLPVLPHVDEGERERVKHICELTTRETYGKRSRRMTELTSSLERCAAKCRDEPALAVLALGADSFTHRRAREQTAAAERLGWRACLRTTSGPNDVNLLPHYEALADFAPGLTICIAHPPGAAPLPKDCRVCEWHPYAHGASVELSSENTIHLAASPAVARTLQQAGVPSRRIEHLFWALPEHALDSASSPSVAKAESTEKTKAVMLFGNLPDASASACGIEQPTHKQLWAQLQQTASQAWDTPDILRAPVLLHKAEQTCGVKLGDPRLHERLVRIIERVLIPASVLQTIVQGLRRRSYEVWTVGGGWRRCTDERINILADDYDQLFALAADEADAAREALYPTAAVFAGSLDPLCPELFIAAARGWPLLLHNPAVQPMTDRLGGVFHPEQHYLPFAGMTQLLERLDSIQRDGSRARRRCERTLEHLRTEHTYGRRLRKLAERLDLDWPANT